MSDTRPARDIAFEPVVLTERGAKDVTSDRRLFVQFFAFTGPRPLSQDAIQSLLPTLQTDGLSAALYDDARDPRGHAVAIAHEDPGKLIHTNRQLFEQTALQDARIRDDYTMMGRTYSLGYEADLEDTLLNRPRRHLLDPEWPWAIWYPLRRAGAFETLEHQQQREILGEHAKIGMTWTRSGLARDIRLAGHGLSGEDNDFILGLFAKELFPLSALVARMRSTVQTSRYLEKLGPFFVGRAIWQSKAPDA
ncbi:chlorite dismutase family protein [Mucisphaera sp.]|uniref:chlorite dismutase family protein n=1 Tax=Mucisphaera sp. TaxID=2913024 RepID=UPI003D0A5776